MEPACLPSWALFNAPLPTQPRNITGRQLPARLEREGMDRRGVGLRRVGGDGGMDGGWVMPGWMEGSAGVDGDAGLDGDAGVDGG